MALKFNVVQKSHSNKLTSSTNMTPRCGVPKVNHVMSNLNQQQHQHQHTQQPQYPHHYNQQYFQHHHNNHHHHHRYTARQHLSQQRRHIRLREYKNLRQVIPSLRIQRTVSKVEVVSEAARYIDHLHKSLLERFVTEGIPDNLKGLLRTQNANHLKAHDIMDLVAKLASSSLQQHQQMVTPSPQQQQPQLVQQTPLYQANNSTLVAKNSNSSSRLPRMPSQHCHNVIRLQHQQHQLEQQQQHLRGDCLSEEPQSGEPAIVKQSASLPPVAIVKSKQSTITKNNLIVE